MREILFKAKRTDEAVEMVIERMEELKNES